MEARALVDHLKQLSDDPQNRSTIVKDRGCLAGLVLFLDNSDTYVITTALQALKNLSEHKPNRNAMKKELGMLESLRAIMHRNDVKAKQLATEIYGTLNHSHQQQARPTTNISSRPPSVLGNTSRRTKTYTIQIKGLTSQITKRICEEQLLTVRGLVSFTFDMTKSRCIVRARPETTAETICQTINKTKLLTAQQIVKNEQGEEMNLCFKSVSHNKSQNKSYALEQSKSSRLSSRRRRSSSNQNGIGSSKKIAGQREPRLVRFRRQFYKQNALLVKFLCYGIP
ncbi:armadillo repeat-containing protein 1-like [Xenia sp. Carnegie-2017]|uniref:armadillo repeat-containing protein 1-like n=1 Tax=Xenia sp. Carnegie-2017 TaxID=2897299 RepID=UPI001F049E14|nr:armadillo repeat-containing protein 1-like [Xenia sp. Carnegie-2017]